MKALEKLRESSHLDDSKWTLETGEVVNVFGYEPDDPNAVNWGEQWRKIADEIEAEIAANYMKRPLDADGVPVGIGDVLTRPMTSGKAYEVDELRYDGETWWFESDEGCFACDCASHVKPDPLKELLTEMLDRNSDGVGYREFNYDFEAFVDAYADRIRELTGGAE